MSNGNYPPRTVRVTVQVNSVNPVDFKFVSSDIAVGPNNELTFKNGGGYKGFLIYYELSGADGYAFPADLDEALYVSQGSKADCPENPSKWGQFKPIGREDINKKPNDRILLVDNKNESPHDFGYMLRAFNADGELLPLDPPGSNQNGDGDDRLTASSSGMVVGAVAAVALIAVAFLVLR